MKTRKRLTLYAFLCIGITAMLCFTTIVTSAVTSSFTIQMSGTIGQVSHGVTFNWKVYKIGTTYYRATPSGTVVASGSSFAAIVNDGLAACAALGKGTIYVVPDTYTATSSIGSNGYSAFNNVELCFGDGTVVTRSSGGQSSDYLIYVWDSGNAGTTNFTITSNGTAILNAAGYCDGTYMRLNYYCTYSNLVLQHLYGQGVYQMRSRYCTFENFAVFSYDEGAAEQSAFGSNDVQYNTYRNIVLDGNNQANTRVGFYFGDWEDYTGWSGTFFNNVNNLWIKNVRRDGIYLNSGVAGTHVYNNTFNNCTIENNWQTAYDAIKLRPAQYNTFTNIFIRNFTDAITTGTNGYGESLLGGAQYNSVTATVYGCTNTAFILTTDDNGMNVDHNFFNITIVNSNIVYCSSGSTSVMRNNIFYLNLIQSAGIYLETGNINQNTFYCSFKNCGTTGHADIRIANNANLANNIFHVLAETGNPKGIFEGTLGTNQVLDER